MNHLPATAVKATAALMQSLFFKKEPITSESIIRSDSTWAGSGCGSVRQVIDHSFFEKIAKLPPLPLSEESWQTLELADDMVLCEYACMAGKEQLPLHAALLFQEKDSYIRLRHLHLSFSLLNPSRPTVQSVKPDENTPTASQEEISTWKAALLMKERELEVSSEVQKILSEELEQAHRQMQVVLGAIQGGLKISRMDEEYSYLFVSDDVFNLFGYTREEFFQMSGGTAFGAVYEGDRPRIAQECLSLFANGNLEYTAKYRIACKNGNLKWIIDTGKRVQDEQGNWIVNSIYLDVTDLELANQKIVEQRELLESIYNSVMCGILRYRSENGQFTYLNMNHKALEMMGYTSTQECIDKGVDEFFHRICDEERENVISGITALRSPGDSFRCEYRIQPPGGENRWIYGISDYLPNVDGQCVVQQIMIDMTDKKQLELALEEERQRFRIAAECTPVMIFEYDIATDVFTSYGTLEESQEKHEMDLRLGHFLESVMATQVEAPYQEGFRKLLTGERSVPLEIRISSYYQSPRIVWASVSVTSTTGKQAPPSRIFGKISNIQSEKEKEEKLQTMKTRDGLTGLYNKEYGVQLIQEYMSQKNPDEICGLMLFDMDDFRRINHKEGRVFADALLQEVADILRAESGPEDIQVRLGGDEFMLFVKNCPKSRATILGPRIAEQIRGLLFYSEKDLQISASIGMCVTSVVDEYAGLYRCAESTLRYVKSHERGRAACYLDTSNELGIMLTQLYTDTYEVNKVDPQTIGNRENMVSFVLDLLGKSNNLNDAVYLLLTRLGKSLGLDRVSLLEVDNEYLSWSYSYQWARKQSDLQVGKKFYLTQEELSEVSSSYDEMGLSEKCVVAQAFALGSQLSAAIFYHGVYAGALRFEVREQNHVWPVEQRKMLRELTRILPSFLMKARADAISQAKTDFLSRMSHEIRTPMNAIAGMTHIAKTVLDDRTKAMDCLNKIDSANSYLLNLINDVLDMSRIESGKMELNPQSLVLSRFFENLESLHSPLAAEKHLNFRMENEYHANHPVLADELRLNQVLVNIIGNAIKFTPNGGSVCARVSLLLEKPKGVVLRFSVEDTGIGIHPSALDRIFNAFEQADKGTSAQHGGTGLGLSISSRLVQMMGGTLEVKSKLGKGSEFFFTLSLPYSQDQTSETALPVTTTAQIDFSGKRLLLAEDNEINREIAAEILMMYGFQVECAVDGKEAVDLFGAHEPGYYDGILMDIRMPVMDGLEATRKIRTSGKTDSRTIPIIAMTANAFDEDSKKSIESGMNGHLTKPIQIDVFLSTLRNCL